MKKIVTILLIMIGHNLVAQQLPSTAEYAFSNKTKDFSQADWLNIMRDIANDTFILNRMKGLEKGPIIVSHLPYACWVNYEHKIVLQFCPDCNWILTSLTSTDCVTLATLVSPSYGFELEQVHIDGEKGWAIGDTVPTLIFLMANSSNNRSGFCECILTPVALRDYVPAYAIYPKSVKRKN